MFPDDPTCGGRARGTGKVSHENQGLRGPEALDLGPQGVGIRDVMQDAAIFYYKLAYTIWTF